MQKEVHRANTRGISDHGWLSSRFSFSFADWYQPLRMGFGALRVLNDDTIAPKSGFPPHSHKDMEIITIVSEGAVTHKDSMGNSFEVPEGDVQVMTAGTGVTHAELNERRTPLALFQIWILPREKSVAPKYAQKTFGYGREKLLVSPDGRDESLQITQDAFITKVTLEAGESYTYSVKEKHNGVYVFVVRGGLQVCGETLEERDALGVWEVGVVEGVAQSNAELLLIEVPK